MICPMCESLLSHCSNRKRTDVPADNFRAHALSPSTKRTFVFFSRGFSAPPPTLFPLFVTVSLAPVNRHATPAGSLFWSKSVQRAYDRRHKGQPNKVQLNDAVFALHAAFISFVTLAQVGSSKAAQPCVPHHVRARDGRDPSLRSPAVRALPFMVA